MDLRTGGFVQQAVATLVALPVSLSVAGFDVRWTPAMLFASGWLASGREFDRRDQPAVPHGAQRGSEQGSQPVLPDSGRDGADGLCAAGRDLERDDDGGLSGDGGCGVPVHPREITGRQGIETVAISTISPR